MNLAFDRRVQEICRAAIGHPRAQWESIIEAAREKDPDVVREALSLLEADGRAEDAGFMSMLDVAPTAGGPGVPQPSAVPERIGPYPVECRVGEGGMGVVYRARDEELGRAVAIKALSPKAAAHPDSLARFKQEMQTVGRLRHTNIVHAYHTFEESGVHYLVMEYVDGEDLETRVKRLGPLPVAEACELVRQAAEGLQHAHEQGVVHRDVKPSNLLRSADGTLKVVDFGIAVLKQEQDRPDRLTGPVVAMGTIDYMAPEQQRGMAGVDIRADIYALGCTFYHLLTGNAPFADRREPCLILAAHREDAPPPAETPDGPVPPGLQAILDRMLAKDPDDRFQTPGEVARALANLDRHGCKGAICVFVRLGLAFACLVVVLGVLALLRTAPGHVPTSASSTAPDTEDLARRAEQRAISGDLAGAFVEYRSLAESDPDNLDVYRKIEQCARGEEKLRKPYLEFALRQVERRPQSAAAHNYLGNACLLLDPKDAEGRAAEEYRRALEIDLNFAPPLNNLAILAHREGNAARAESLFRGYLERCPEDAEAWTNLGTLHVVNVEANPRDMEEVKAAKHALARALDLEPGLARRYKWVGRLFAATGEVEEALAAYRVSNRLDPDPWVRQQIELLEFRRKPAAEPATSAKMEENDMDMVTRGLRTSQPPSEKRDAGPRISKH